MSGIFNATQNFGNRIIDKNYDIKKKDTVNLSARLDICKLYPIGEPVKETFYLGHHKYIDDYDYDHRDLDKYLYKNQYDKIAYFTKLEKRIKEQANGHIFSVSQKFIVLINNSEYNYAIKLAQQKRLDIPFPFAFLSNNDAGSTLICTFFIVVNKEDFGFMNSNNNHMLQLRSYVKDKEFESVMIKWDQDNVIDVSDGLYETNIIMQVNIPISTRITEFDMYSSVFTKWIVSFNIV